MNWLLGDYHNIDLQSFKEIRSNQIIIAAIEKERTRITYGRSTKRKSGFLPGSQTHHAVLTKPQKQADNYQKIFLHSSMSKGVALYG